MEVSIDGAPVDIDQSLYSSDNTENGNVYWDGLTGFGNGATFNAGATDATHGQVFHVASGTGYSPEDAPGTINSAFAAFTNWGNPAGYEAYNTFNVKVTDTPSGIVELQMIGGTASIAQVTLATDPNATDLGGGWYG